MDSGHEIDATVSAPPGSVYMLYLHYLLPDKRDTSATGRLRQATIRYDTRCYFNVRSKADISQLNLPHGTDN